ncbi:Exocyst complex component Sec3, C-terminal [Phytophthora cactorum]|nr:Exocyst complex component Sec3, C-terminal [Phytophthora cactorum]
MEASKVKPLGSISRDDVRHTLHTHFHSSKPAPRPSTGGVSSPSVSNRKRVFSFVQVQKPKSEAETKRLFSHAANTGKYFVLCVTVQDSNAAVKVAAQLELHYVQLLSNLSVDVRNSWNLSGLDTIEHNGIGPEKPKGAFALFFSGETASWQWLVEARESTTAMHEFLWSLCALAVQNNTTLPRLVRINVEELHETATRLNLQKVYDLEIDLVHSVAEMKKSGSLEEHPAAGEETGSGKKAIDIGIDVSGLRLASPESNEALTMLNDVSWSDVQLSAVEDDLRKKLRTLEDENIAFLLSLDGETVAPSGQNTSNFTSVDKILEAIDAVQNRITLIQDWTNESDEYLGQTSSSMKHFEALNNQLEMHFKNSVALEQVLSKLMAQVEISKEHMRIFTSPVDVFPGEVGGSTTGVTKDRGGDAGRDVGVTERIRTAIAAIAAMDQAIKSTKELPASEMVAFRARGDELSRLATGFGEKLCASFDVFLQRKIKQLPNSRGGDGVRGRDLPAGTRNILDALSLVVLVNGKLEEYRPQSAFLYNVMVSFQLQMKRMLIKFTEDQNMIARMEESVAGKSTDSTLVSIYNMIIPSTMHWIDKVADTRPKYAPLTRLENFLFLSDNLKTINASKDLPLSSMQRSTRTIHGKLPTPLIASIESLMATVPAPEIQYHLPRQEVRRVLDSTSSTFEKSVRVMHDRLKKHFRENSKMLPSVWKQLITYGTRRMAVYALVAGDCYQLRFEPSPERGLELLNKFAFSS